MEWTYPQADEMTPGPSSVDEVVSSLHASIDTALTELRQMRPGDPANKEKLAKVSSLFVVLFLENVRQANRMLPSAANNEVDGADEGEGCDEHGAYPTRP